MGNTDVVTKNYMRQNTVFADACNYLIYGGRNIVDPEKLTELDPTELGVLFETDSYVRDMDKPETIQKYRDVLKSAVIMQDDRAAYLILGIENQTDIHYAMPVRNMIYDALQYGKQVDETSRKNRKEKTKKSRNRGEYLSGFYKEDKLIPVITFVIHVGADEWDGPMSVKEMMDPQDETLLEYIQDYRIHLIDPARLTEEELGKFRSSLREILSCVKYSKDKEKLKEYLHASSRIPDLDISAKLVLKSIIGLPTNMKTGKEKFNMCKAIDDWIEEERNEGKSEGRLDVLVELVKEGMLSIKDASVKASMREDEFQKIVKNAGKAI